MRVGALSMGALQMDTRHQRRATTACRGRWQVERGSRGPEMGLGSGSAMGPGSTIKRHLASFRVLPLHMFFLKIHTIIQYPWDHPCWPRTERTAAVGAEVHLQRSPPGVAGSAAAPAHPRWAFPPGHIDPCQAVLWERPSPPQANGTPGGARLSWLLLLLPFLGTLLWDVLRAQG